MTDRGLRTLQQLIFRTEPQDLAAELAAFRAEQKAIYNGATDEALKAEAVELIAENAVDLQSVLTEWHLKCAMRHGDRALCDGALAEEAEKSLALVVELGAQGVAEAARANIASIKKSQLARLTRLSLAGKTNTWWGNDYAAGLRETMRRGAAMVTTNPVLVNVARNEDPGYWTPVRDQIRAAHPTFDPVQLAYAMTIQVVLYNARLLRPIWELTDGKMGYVSLQLSPKASADAEVMIKEAHWVWEQLESGLDGTPNCVFKAPGTKAGIDLVCDAVSHAMGVNVTVNFALPQQIVFAGAIESNSTCKVSYRTQMDGRLDDPVGDELKDAGVSDWDEVKKWCTTAIRQREYRLLSLPPQEGGLGFTKSIPLPASGRGPWNIERSITDGPVPIFLTVFPNRQSEFDEEERILNPKGMWEELPAEYLDKLNKSKLFRQAYEPDGMTVDEFDGYKPVVDTLKQFNTSYDEFVAWVAGGCGA